MRALVLSLAVVAALTAPGCGPSCHPTERTITEGVRKTAGPYREFATSVPGGPYLPFEGGTLLKIRHGLGVDPSMVDVSVSFTERPLDQYKGGYSDTAGNQAITLRHDIDEIAIKNDSCANYYVRVVVIGLVGDDAGAGDATAGDSSVTDAAIDDAADSD